MGLTTLRLLLIFAAMLPFGIFFNLRFNYCWWGRFLKSVGAGGLMARDGFNEPGKASAPRSAEGNLGVRVNGVN